MYAKFFTVVIKKIHFEFMAWLRLLHMVPTLFVRWLAIEINISRYKNKTSITQNEIIAITARKANNAVRRYCNNVIEAFQCSVFYTMKLKSEFAVLSTISSCVITTLLNLQQN